MSKLSRVSKLDLRNSDGVSFRFNGILPNHVVAWILAIIVYGKQPSELEDYSAPTQEQGDE